MARSAAVSSLLCLLGTFNANAQFPPEISFCPAGVQANGFIDWSKLPRTPTSGSVNVTIPVSGVSGLNATVQIPTCLSFGGRPCYSVVNSADLSLPGFGTEPISITFSQAVQGVSVVARTVGRFGHDFQMSANDWNGKSILVSPPPAQVASSGFDYPVEQVSTAPLQILSTSANLTSVTFQLSGDDAEYPVFELINLRVQTASSPDPSKQVPTDGLKEWLRADRALASPNPFLNPVLTWPDQSANNADAIAPSASSAPDYKIDGPNCTPVLSFDGSQLLNLRLPIEGLTGMTVILATQSYANPSGWSNSALAWKEHVLWGTTFVDPFQTQALFRFGTRQVNNQPIYTRPTDIGGDFSITTTIHDNDIDSLYINGSLALRQGGKQPVIAGAGPIGTIGGGEGNAFFTGNIGEVLIYDRALSNSERERVEHYLMAKYGVQ